MLTVPSTSVVIVVSLFPDKLYKRTQAVARKPAGPASQKEGDKRNVL